MDNLSTIFLVKPFFWVEEKRFLKNPITPEDIISIICVHYGVTFTDLVGKRRFRRVVEPRHMAVYMIDHFTTLTLHRIGICLGGRDHTTVIHSLNHIKDLMETDPKVMLDKKRIIIKIKDHANNSNNKPEA